MEPEAPDPREAVETVPHRSRVWRGPEPDSLHRLLFTACGAEESHAVDAWNRWLRECHFEDEDPASYELASVAVGRLGCLAGDGSEASRCRGWSRRAWYVSGIAMEAAERVTQAAARHGLDAVPVGDLATAKAGLRFAGRPFPVRRVEFHVAGASLAAMRELQAAAMGGSAGEAIRTRRLGLDLRSGALQPVMARASGRIAWLAARNWCRFPPGRLRWMLEIAANLDADPEVAASPRELVEAARCTGKLAAVGEALCWMEEAGVVGARLGRIVTAIRAEPVPVASRLRLWHARHQLGLGLRSRLSRLMRPARKATGAVPGS